MSHDYSPFAIEAIASESSSMFGSAALTVIPFKLKVQCMTYKVRLHAIKQVCTAKRIWSAGLPGRPEHGQGCQHRHPPAGPRAVAGAQCGAHPCEAAASTAFSVTPSGKLGCIAASITFPEMYISGITFPAMYI